MQKPHIDEPLAILQQYLELQYCSSQTSNLPTCLLGSLPPRRLLRLPQSLKLLPMVLHPREHPTTTDAAFQNTMPLTRVYGKRVYKKKSVPLEDSFFNVV